MSATRPRHTKCLSLLASLFLVVVAARTVVRSDDVREVRVSTTAELERALAAAKPGTRVLMAPGSYEGFRISNLNGSDGLPILLAGANHEAPPVISSGVQFSEVSYLELANLIIAGARTNGLNVDDGGTFDTPSHHVTLRNLTIRDCGGRGNDDGIKLSGVDDFRIERVTVERWGRGGSAIDMVGCHRGVIDECKILDRELEAAATGIQAKGGTRDVTIRRSRFEHAGERAINIGGSTGLAYFRPKPESFEAKDITVEGCIFVGSAAPIAFVGVDGATVRRNTFYRPRKWFLRILQETRETDFVPCRHGKFLDNLIAYRSTEVATPVNIGPGTAPETFEFARNYWYCIDAPARSRPNLPVAETETAGGADPEFRNADAGDFRLAIESPARAHGATAFVLDKLK
ncbi:MAG: right-handed parallel beta-helix repeat-containing protein [Planctomycetota bacterium]